MPDGAFIMLCGSSGSGKSTLLNIIGGIDSPTTGKIIIDKRDVKKLHGKEHSKFFRSKVGFIFQGFYLQPQLTVSENIELSGVFAGIDPAVRHKRVEILAEQLGITDVINSKPAEISGGQAERTCIARALFMKPKIILADEPTNNLDSKNAKKVLDLLRYAWQSTGTTMIIVSHDERVEQYTQHIVEIEDGHINIVR